MILNIYFDLDMVHESIKHEIESWMFISISKYHNKDHNVEKRTDSYQLIVKDAMSAPYNVTGYYESPNEVRNNSSISNHDVKCTVRGGNQCCNRMPGPREKFPFNKFKVKILGPNWAFVRYKLVTKAYLIKQR